MQYEIPTDVTGLIKAQLATGAYQNEGDVLRAALEALSRQNADLAAIREGIADVEAGRTRPFEEI
ncbi:MAG: type II toxin-antitoxin system ParD family antitoxin [Pirellulales bacterium]|nr:type II toxin-antitoxin system ParD family antitoxin [Pirellulales bacterium]